MSEECPLCLENVTLRIVPCSNMHAFCEDCINKLLREKGQAGSLKFMCPLCRKPVDMAGRKVENLPENSPVGAATLMRTSNSAAASRARILAASSSSSSSSSSTTEQQCQQRPLPEVPKVPQVMKADMPASMQKAAIQCVQTALSRFSEDDFEIADHVKTEFDRLHGGPWQCIVGRSKFNSSVEGIQGQFICFDIPNPFVRILLFRTRNARGK